MAQNLPVALKRKRNRRKKGKGGASDLVSPGTFMVKKNNFGASQGNSN